MYEHESQKLAPKKIYYRRLVLNAVVAAGILLICLSIGIFGYHYTCNTSWLDSLHNASMILSGMGPVIEIKTTGGKWFSSLYAIFSGIAFITNIGILIAPIAHRFFHKLHLENK
jgi:hypothetical protein